MPDNITPENPIDLAPAKSAGQPSVFKTDINFQRQIRRLLPPAQAKKLAADFDAAGGWVANELEQQAIYTDKYAHPSVETHDRKGEQVRRLIVNPRYQAALTKGNELILRAQMNTAESQMVPFLYGYLMSQSDISIHCPVTMSGAVAYILTHYAPKSVQDSYLPQLRAARAEDLPSGGTWATELHGGSDIGATTTRAQAEGKHWTLHGLKWFTSNAVSGLAIATARPDGAPDGPKGLGLYLVPSHKPDGMPNDYYVRRLKDKIGTRGLPTAETDLKGAYALELAPPPHGLRVMMEALAYSRVHNAMSAAGVSRRCFVEALAWAEDRAAFGKKIATYPMVRETILDLQTQAEAGLALALEAARAFPKNPHAASEADKGWSRFATATAKFLTADMAVAGTQSLLKLVGGNGYTEEFPSARLYRDAPVLMVWEGPENVQALELLRLVRQYPDVPKQFCQRLQAVRDVLPASAGALKTQLGKASTECAQHFKEMAQVPQNAEIHAKKFLDLAAKSLTLALLAEEAAAELSTGDSRKLLVAERFAGWMRMTVPAFSFLDGPEPLQADFLRATQCQKISPKPPMP